MEQSTLSIVFVTDDPADPLAFSRLAAEEGLPFACVHAASTAEGRRHLAAGGHAAIISVEAMADGSAFDLLDAAQQAKVPLVILLEAGHEALASKAMLAGCADFLIQDPERRYVRALPATLEKVLSGRRTAAALQESELRYRSVIDHVGDIIYRCDVSGCFSFYTPAVTRLLGYGKDELIGRHYLDVLPLSARAETRQFYRQQIASRQISSYLELPILGKDGTERWLGQNVQLLMDGEHVIGFQAVARDITERKQAELALLRQNAELAALGRMGQALSRLAPPAELLELIYHIIGEILNNRNLYIALYDEANQRINFPVYTVDGQRVARESRPLGSGLSEYVIRTREPLFFPQGTRSARERGIVPQGRPSRCFLAVPMLAGDKVIGVIGIQDYDRSDAYDRGHLEVLRTVAAQAAIALENARLFGEAQRRAEQLQLISDVERVVTTIMDPALLTAQIAQVIHSRLHIPQVAVGLIEGSELVFRPERAAGSVSEVVHELRLKIDSNSVTGSVAQSGQSMLVPDTRQAPRFQPSEFWAVMLSELAVPLNTQTGVIGVLNLESDQVDAFAPELVSLVETLASQMAIALENARLFAEAGRMARTDTLTGLANRRHLHEVGAQELSRAQRFGHPLSALMLDIDHFKAVNDTYGHASGDEVLRAVARCCLTVTREIDIVARYGGEEFIILLPETEMTGALQLGERLRAGVAESVTDTEHGPVGVTVSVGVAELKPGSTELASLISLADHALYEAKQAGRNRVARLPGIR